MRTIRTTFETLGGEVQDAMEALEEERATVEETKSYLGID